MIQIEITIKVKEGEDIVRKMTYNTKEEAMADYGHLHEFLANYVQDVKEDKQ